jgi:hypothetical protein
MGNATFNSYAVSIAIAFGLDDQVSIPDSMDSSLLRHVQLWDIPPPPSRVPT